MVLGCNNTYVSISLLQLRVAEQVSCRHRCGKLVYGCHQVSACGKQKCRGGRFAGIFMRICGDGLQDMVSAKYTCIVEVLVYRFM